jgi:hypothetical protein
MARNRWPGDAVTRSYERVASNDMYRGAEILVSTALEPLAGNNRGRHSSIFKSDLNAVTESNYKTVRTGNKHDCSFLLTFTVIISRYIKEF